MQLGGKPAALIEKLAKHKIERLSKTAVAAEDKPAANVERTPCEQARPAHEALPPTQSVSHAQSMRRMSTKTGPLRRAPDQAKTDENDATGMARFLCSSISVWEIKLV